MFNDTLYELKEWCQLSNKTSSRQGFWKLLKSKSITIITSEEAKDTHIKGVTVKDAEKVNIKKQRNTKLTFQISSLKKINRKLYQ